MSRHHPGPLHVASVHLKGGTLRRIKSSGVAWQVRSKGRLNSPIQDTKYLFCDYPDEEQAFKNHVDLIIA